MFSVASGRTAPNVLWFTDITYLRTWEGWLYLAAVQDAYSRRIVGWQMADHMRQELVIRAVEMAVSQRRPDPGLIHHSDQGGQYVSYDYTQVLDDHRVRASVGTVGDAYDALAETFFATLKKELIYRRSWPTRRELEGEVFDYIEAFYNRRRRRSLLGMLSPSDYEAQTEGAARY